MNTQQKYLQMYSISTENNKIRTVRSLYIKLREVRIKMNHCKNYQDLLIQETNIINQLELIGIQH